ncbi:hypothetical protein SAMN05216338_10768 [Bradyrhizobium sp. Rc2d]|nr:hypothetical protein SAMN05216338_10768 [Bradyrhizobium sp. Rc2d]
MRRFGDFQPFACTGPIASHKMVRMAKGCINLLRVVIVQGFQGNFAEMPTAYAATRNPHGNVRRATSRCFAEALVPPSDQSKRLAFSMAADKGKLG